MQAGRCAFSMHCKSGISLDVIVSLCAQERDRLEIKGIDTVSDICCTFLYLRCNSRLVASLVANNGEHMVVVNVTVMSTRSGASLRTFLGDIADRTKGG
jgi:hypothetical protein